MCEVFKVSLSWIRHKACIKCCICSCGIPFNVSYCCIHLCSRFLSHFYVCFCLAVSVSPFFLLGWGHHMHGLFVWSCYRNSCECVSVCVNMSVWRGCSSASCVMTSSRHRPRHIESVCFHGLCNGESPTHTQTHIHTHTPAPLADAPSVLCLVAWPQRSHEAICSSTSVQLHLTTGTMCDCSRTWFHIVHKWGIRFIWMGLYIRPLSRKGERKFANWQWTLVLQGSSSSVCTVFFSVSCCYKPSLTPSLSPGLKHLTFLSC